MEIEPPQFALPNKILSKAVADFASSGEEKEIQVWLNGEKEHPYNASYFLRSFAEMPEAEQVALSLSKGHILDVGAGAGAHSSYLLSQEKEVTALESEAGFCSFLSKLPDLKVINEDFFKWQTSEKYDTILLLMNGLGISETKEKLAIMFSKLNQLLSTTGKLLIEITDYRFSPEYDHAIMDNPEVKFRLMYEGIFSEEFNWLYPNLDMIDSLCEINKLTPVIRYQEDETLLLEVTRKTEA